VSLRRYAESEDGKQCDTAKLLLHYNPKEKGIVGDRPHGADREIIELRRKQTASDELVAARQALQDALIASCSLEEALAQAEQEEAASKASAEEASMALENEKVKLGSESGGALFHLPIPKDAEVLALHDGVVEAKREYACKRRTMEDLQFDLKTAKQEAANKKYLVDLMLEEEEGKDNPRESQRSQPRVAKLLPAAHTVWAQRERERLCMRPEQLEDEADGSDEPACQVVACLDDGSAPTQSSIFSPSLNTVLSHARERLEHASARRDIEYQEYGGLGEHDPVSFASVPAWEAPYWSEKRKKQRSPRRSPGRSPACTTQKSSIRIEASPVVNEAAVQAAPKSDIMEAASAESFLGSLI